MMSKNFQSKPQKINCQKRSSKMTQKNKTQLGPQQNPAIQTKAQAKAQAKRTTKRPKQI